MNWRMEVRRAEATDAKALQRLRRGWCLGSDTFKQQMLERMEGLSGEHHSGALRHESAEVKAGGLLRRNFAAWAGWNPNWRNGARPTRASWRWPRGCGGKRPCRSNGLRHGCGWARPRAPTRTCINGCRPTLNRPPTRKGQRQRKNMKPQNEPSYGLTLYSEMQNMRSCGTRFR